jgi:hypothetical protein
MARTQGIIAYIAETLLTASSDAASSLQAADTTVLIPGSTAWVDDKQALYRWIDTALLTPIADKVINGNGGGQWVLAEGGSDPVEVFTLADLPAAIGGVITLVNGRVYRIHGVVGLGAAVIVMGIGSSLIGVGAGQLTTNNTISLVTGPAAGSPCTVKDMWLVNTGGPAFEWQGNGNTAQCVLQGSRFYGITSAALILGVTGDYININGCTFNGTTAGLEIGGAWSSVVLNSCRFFGPGNQVKLTGTIGTCAQMTVNGCEFRVTGATDIGIEQTNVDAVTVGRIVGCNFSVSGGGALAVGTNVVTTEWVSNTNAGLANF